MGKEAIEKSDKNGIISTIDMEIGISNLFDYSRNIIVPNLSWGFNIHECDLFIVRESGYAFEVEIKRSKSDLIKDFKKNHNHQDKENRLCELYYAIPTDLLDSCQTIIPENAGIIVCKNVYTKKGKKKQVANIIKKAKRIKGARRLTQEEQFKIARLAGMRIWGLKKKLSILK